MIEKTGQNLFVVVLRLSPSAIKGQVLQNWEPSEKKTKQCMYHIHSLKFYFILATFIH